MTKKRRFKLNRRWYLLYTRLQRRLHGVPIDRYYIEGFLVRNAHDVRGRVLEVGDRNYTVRYGQDRGTCSDVLHVNSTNPLATIVGDLADAPQIPDACFDAIILTQTLQYIYDARAALRTLHRILTPGGVLLLTAPALAPVATKSVWGYTWHWIFTALSLERMLAEIFGPSCVRVETRGNVLAAMAFLQGLAAEELAPEELDITDPDYAVTLLARAQKRATDA